MRNKGIKCPKCGANIDNSDFDFAQGICIECAIEHRKMLDTNYKSDILAKSNNFEQIRLEDIYENSKT